MSTIELDCPPGNPRPDALLPLVLKDTGIVVDADKPVSKCFGNWCWQIPSEQEEAYQAVKETIATRIKGLYDQGLIRYGSW